MAGELVEFEEGTIGIALNLDHQNNDQINALRIQNLASNNYKEDFPFYNTL